MGASISESQRRALRTLLLIAAMLVLTVVGATAAALYLKKPPDLPPEEPSALEPSPEHLNFGEVWEDTQFTIALPITNRRAQDIEIKRFHRTCNCSEIKPPSLSIPAGQTREVLVSLDLSPRHQEELGLAVQCDPPFVDFGSVSELAHPLPSQRVKVKTFVPVRSLKATCPSLLFEVKAERRSPKEADLFDLIISPSEPVQKRDIRCTVELKAVLADGKILPVKTLQVVGRIVGDIESSSPAVMFGACPVGTTVAETISLRSLTGRKFAVTGVRCKGDGLTVKRVEEASSSAPTFRLEQKIGVKGERQGEVIFGVRPDGGKNGEVVVVVSYCGIESGTK